MLPSSEADSRSVKNLRLHNHVHKTPPLDTNLCQMNSVNDLVHFLFNSHYKVNLTSEHS